MDLENAIRDLSAEETKLSELDARKVLLQKENRLTEGNLKLFNERLDLLEKVLKEKMARKVEPPARKAHDEKKPPIVAWEKLFWLCLILFIIGMLMMFIWQLALKK